jgi:hypothetical protein
MVVAGQRTKVRMPLGYFCIDSADQQTPASSGTPVFNRIITLRDSWSKANKP